MLVDKNTCLWWCGSLPSPTDRLLRESKLACREVVVKEQENEKKIEELAHGWSLLVCKYFSKKVKEKDKKKIISPSKRESKTMRGKGCAKVQRRQAWAIWILIGEGYFRPGIALALWQQIHKALASHQSLSHNWWPFWKQKQQLFSNPDHLHWFKSLSEWFSIDKKPHFLNCEWAVGITFTQAGLSWLLIVEEKDGSRFSGEIMNKMFLVSRVALAWELLLSTVPGPWMRQVTMTPWLLSNMGIINRFLTP